MRNAPPNDGVGRRIMNIALCLLGALILIVSLNHHQQGWFFRVPHEHYQKKDVTPTTRNLHAYRLNFYNIQNLPKVTTATQKQSAQKGNKMTNGGDEMPKPKGVAWLMGFPNSGTLFTTDLTATASLSATGTNYGNQLLKQLGRDFVHDPAYALSNQGPYKTSQLPLPDGYLLTKTYCAGHCVECPPEKFLTTIDEFATMCRSGLRPKTSKEMEDESDPRPNKGVRYDPSLVEKAIVMFRNPFDNVVANFRWAGRKRRRKEGTDGTFGNDSDGFKEWCRGIDGNYRREEGSWYSPLVESASRGVPCHGQFYQYIHWYENAVETTERMGISRLDVFYEDYHTKYDETLDAILEYLELPRRGRNPVPFRWKTKGYSEFYTKDELISIQIFIRLIASDRVYRLLGRYFDDPTNEKSSKTNKFI